MAETEGRTEAPSAQRLEKAREDGQIAYSREAMTFACLLGGAAGVFLLLPLSLPGFVHLSAALMQNAGSVSLTPSGLLAASTLMLTAGVKLALLPCGAILAMALCAGLMQTGFLFNTGGLAPKLSRASPAAGLKRILGGGTLPDTLKAIAKLALFALVIRQIAIAIIPALRDTVGLAPAPLTTTALAVCRKGALALILAQLAVAGADLLWTRSRHIAKLRMTKEELKDEYKNAEGDPHIKGKLKALRARAARKRIRDGVKNATVIVTNPTHYAVALQYERGSSAAPRIVAKGVDEVAARIRELAWEFKIPIVPNPPLARALHALPIDTEIPAEHFRVVASIISYVWKLRQPASQGPPVR